MSDLRSTKAETFLAGPPVPRKRSRYLVDIPTIGFAHHRAANSFQPTEQRAVNSTMHVSIRERRLVYVELNTVNSLRYRYSIIGNVPPLFHCFDEYHSPPAPAPASHDF